MTTVYDVPADTLIKEAAKRFKEIEAIDPPHWAPYVKTGIHREMAPVDPDWWYTRAASMLRKIYMLGPIGVERLSAEYGGRVDRGSKPYHPWKGSRSIVRKAFMQLEVAGFVAKDKNKGRVVTAQGKKFLDGIAKELEKK